MSGSAKEITKRNWHHNWKGLFDFLSDIDNSNNFQSLYTAKSFLNWKVVLNNRQMSVLNAYSDIICLQTYSNKHQFISHLLDSIWAKRCKVEKKPPTVWRFISFNLISLGSIRNLKNSEQVYYSFITIYHLETFLTHEIESEAFLAANRNKIRKFWSTVKVERFLPKIDFDLRTIWCKNLFRFCKYCKLMNSVQ